MKIAFVCPYSYPSSCGVWSVVYQIAKQLQKKGHEIHIFSSRTIRGTKKKSKKHEVYEGMHFHRFDHWLSLKAIGKTTHFWKGFLRELFKINPDIIHTHNYRHPQATITPFIAKAKNIPVFHTTHAPFLEKGIRSSIFSEVIVNLYDAIIGMVCLNTYNKVFTIAKWEIPILKNLGVKKEKIEYVGNGFPKDFLKLNAQPGNKVLYMGRIADVKNLQTIVNVAKQTPNYNFTIYGPDEGINLKSQSKNLKIISKRYTQKEEIRELKKHNIFLLPSKREGIPLALLEAMAAGLLAISSKTQGGKEVIQDKKTGFLFPIDGEKELKSILNNITTATHKKLTKKAKESIKQLTWENITKKIEREYKK